MKCYKCEKAEFAKRKVEFTQFGISLGKFDALVCPICEETVFEGKISKQIEEQAKKAGIWGLARRTSIGTSGSSLDVKVPKAIAEVLKLKKGQEVIIEPTAKNKIEITVV
ncbi:hypothetical protein HYS47_00165 [Candidatus Woesearchaeota archaeon]|nr:hypothetical protein [Candidatus Woesearchaeota archaeon]